MGRLVWILLLAVLAVGGPLLGAGAATRPGPAVTVYGAAGSFGALDKTTRLPTGERVATRPVPGFGFRPGQAAFFTAVAPDGTVMIANEPQTDNQVSPTARNMVVSTFDPESLRFDNVVIPTSRGRRSATNPWTRPGGIVGGADISDLQTVTVDGTSRVAFLSAAPYHHWDTRTVGSYPTLGYLRRDGGRWVYDAESAVSTRQVRRSTPAGRRLCRATRTIFDQPMADCHSPVEFALLPHSRHLVVTHYAPGRGRTSGGLSVLDTSGRVVATFAYPDVTRADGTPLLVYPREVETDPTSQPGDERFAVVFDVFTRHDRRLTARPFTLQEFAFRAGRIVPVSAPVVSGERNDTGRAGFGTVEYDRHGNLWASQSYSGTFTGAGLAVYIRRDGARRLSTDCAASPGGAAADWARACRPDLVVGQARPAGLIFSLTEIPDSGMVAVTISGQVLAVVPTDGTYAARPTVDLGLGMLVDRRRRRITPRQGAVDPDAGVLWVPVQQLHNDHTCPAYPCRPRALDQWLVRIDLERMLR